MRKPQTLGHAGNLGNGLNSKERAAIMDYQNHDFEGINKGLRNPPPAGKYNGSIKALDSALSKKTLPHDKDEREVLEQVKAIVGQQVDALNAFTDQIEAGDYEGREDVLRGRAALYATGLKSSYWGGKTDGADLPCLPGGCEECYSNCRCVLDIKEDGIYWQCTEDDRSCSACVERGNTWTPYHA